MYSEIPIDFPFRQMGQAYSLTLASKETQGETEGKTEIRIPLPDDSVGLSMTGILRMETKSGPG